MNYQNTYMRQNLLNAKLLFFIFSFAILSFLTSCEKDEVKGSFLISGKVFSEADSTAVRNIIVEVRDTKLVETSHTDWNGEFMAEIYDFPGDRTFQVRFSDTDGTLNGEFVSFDTTVVFKDPVFVNADGEDWAGYCEQILNVKLKPKK
jgi:putative lipoprotein (rSAM/lipoprotein system)